MCAQDLLEGVLTGRKQLLNKFVMILAFCVD